MFGGVILMLNGNMCFGTFKDDFVVRVGPKRYEDALALPHARPIDFTGRTIKGFVHVDSKGWSKDATLKKWLHRVLTTPLHFPENDKAKEGSKVMLRAVMLF